MMQHFDNYEVEEMEIQVDRSSIILKEKITHVYLYRGIKEGLYRGIKVGREFYKDVEGRYAFVKVSNDPDDGETEAFYCKIDSFLFPTFCNAIDIFERWHKVKFHFKCDKEWVIENPNDLRMELKDLENPYEEE